MEQYNVTGMSCAACQARVEKAVNSVEGVKSCAVSLLTNSMGVEGNANPEDIIRAIEKAGYGASLKTGYKGAGNNKNSTGRETDSGTQTTTSRTAGNSATHAKDENTLADKETPKILKRFIASLIFLLPLLYVSMGHMLWSWPLPPFLDQNHIAMGLYELLLSAVVMIINQKFFISGFKALIYRAPNMDTLVSLGAGASFGYSVFALFCMTGASGEKVLYYMDQFYFESAAMILTLITFGKMLEAKSKGKTTSALKALMNLAPKTAVLLIDGKKTEVSIDEVKVGDQFVVRPGDSIPVDGIVLEGESAVNESALTGESVPVEKKPGQKVSAATINTSGYMVCRATSVGEDTTLAGIIRMVSDAAATKAPVAKIADRVSAVFVPSVITIALVTLAVWLLAGKTFGYAIARAVSVLVISCPCALGLATPVAIMVGNGVGAKSGILFKTAAALEQAGKTKIIALDKTGTITTGIMTVTDIFPESEDLKDELISVAYALESKSEHPISKAIVEYAEKNLATENKSCPKNKNESGKAALEIENFQAVSGNGLRAVLKTQTEIAGGNAAFITGLLDGEKLDKEQEALISKLASQGKTPVLFEKNKKLLGIVAVSDTLKEDSVKAVSELKKMGLKVVMLTGDNEITAKTIAAQAGITEVIANVKPEGKAETIKELKKSGNTAMVGDGINDSPALTCADLGIAIGAGTDIALDAADVVLMKNSIMDVVAAIRISRATLKNIHENLFWAFFYNVIGIPLAAGCYIAAFGWTLNPMFGAAAMGLSSFCVVSNALRLNFVKPYGKKIISNKKPDGGKKMKIKVNGMMCEHCEAHVKKALETVAGIKSAAASHTDGLVTIETSRSVDEKLLKKAVTEAGYEYAGIVED